MTAADFANVSIDTIIVNRPERQRRELRDIESLMDSISTVGLINPPVITRDRVLIAGERRLTACLRLGWLTIPVQWSDEIDPAQLHLIELEENVKRVDLDWKDQVRAVEEYHRLRSTSPDWKMGDTAKALGLSPAETSRKLAVARELASGNAMVAAASGYSVARGIVERATARANDTELSKLNTIMAQPQSVPVFPDKLPEPTPEIDDGSRTILVADFNSWAPAYTGPKFNFLHCDFPYGIGADTFNQGSAGAHGGYDDSEDVYWRLVRTLCDNLDRLASPSAHLIFWFSMKFYHPTLELLTRETDFVVDPFPLIWHKSDNVGTLPNPSLGGRRTYETAFFAHRGGRPVVSPVAISFTGPTVRDRHMSEKPEPVLRHFFRMVCDTHTVALDPTAGSGSAIRACESLGGTALGLELNPEFADRARSALIAARNQEKTDDPA